jgi:hypothetical protein
MARVYDCDLSHASTRPDGIQDSPRRGEGRTLARRQHTSSRRRGAMARCGVVDGAVAEFALARVYGGTQMLGAYAHETGEAKALQRLGLLTFAWSRSATRPWRHSGWRSLRWEGARGFSAGGVQRRALGRRRDRASNPKGSAFM